jgi:hypothetical protein
LNLSLKTAPESNKPSLENYVQRLKAKDDINH